LCTRHQTTDRQTDRQTYRQPDIHCTVYIRLGLELFHNVKELVIHFRLVGELKLHFVKVRQCIFHLQTLILLLLLLLLAQLYLLLHYIHDVVCTLLVCSYLLYIPSG